MIKRVLVFCWLAGFGAMVAGAQSSPSVTCVASGLLNPRGVAALPDGRLLLAEAGTGYVPAEGEGVTAQTGRISVLDDRNGDGDFLDADEVQPVLQHLPGYNILYQFNPGRDEIVGLGDVLTLPDGRAFFTLDDNFRLISVMALDVDAGSSRTLATRSGSINALAYDPTQETIYMAESTANALSAVTLDGGTRHITNFDLLDNDQQSVPSGLARHPQTGDLWVTLFSGSLWDYYGELLSFMPGDSQVVSVNPESGEITEQIANLTTAVDLTFDPAGNLYVVEMTTQWPTPTIPHYFDLHDPDGPPDAGGYARFTGRVTLYPADGGERVIIVDDLDAPTNISLIDGDLLVSVGQGTPGRPIWTGSERGRIDGQLLRIDLADTSGQVTPCAKP